MESQLKQTQEKQMSQHQARGQLPESDVLGSAQQDRHELDEPQNRNKIGHIKRPMK